jgi:hypothetical protein
VALAAGATAALQWQLAAVLQLGQQWLRWQQQQQQQQWHILMHWQQKWQWYGRPCA